MNKYKMVQKNKFKVGDIVCLCEAFTLSDYCLCEAFTLSDYFNRIKKEDESKQFIVTAAPSVIGKFFGKLYHLSEITDEVKSEFTVHEKYIIGIYA